MWIIIYWWSIKWQNHFTLTKTSITSKLLLRFKWQKLSIYVKIKHIHCVPKKRDHVFDDKLNWNCPFKELFGTLITRPSTGVFIFPPYLFSILGNCWDLKIMNLVTHCWFSQCYNTSSSSSCGLSYGGRCRSYELAPRHAHRNHIS